MAKTFFIYRSSAGSGKTRTLAREYLKLALKYRAAYFRHILAVTFTNKSSQEMKDRILFYLDEFAQGRPNELADELKADLNHDDQTFQQHSQETQAELLHHYSQFSISTIDAFFQKVIRSFTRESGLVGDYRLEVEHDEILEEVINNLIDELGSNQELTEWVVDFAKENLENERAWDVRLSLMEFAKEIFREEFREIEDEVNQATSRKGYFRELKEALWKTKMSFLYAVSKPAQEALSVIESNGWSLEDFKHGKQSGLFTFLRMFAFEKNISKLKVGDRIRSTFTDAEQWAGKSSPHAKEIYRLASEKLVAIVNTILHHYDSSFKKAFSAEIALRNLYVFGLISDISRKLKEYKDENNLMLLADAPKFLNGVIQDSDTPFIYEKVGSFYRNFLIDEFQDTSGMQWKNFQPLIVNSLDQGHHSVVVGDVKQAIYRWRGGDLRLLQQDIIDHVGKERVDVNELDSNFRSAPTLVQFNNELFAAASSIVALSTGTSLPSGAYQDVQQKSKRTENGFVDITFIQEDETDNSIFSSEPSDKWGKIAMEKIPLYLEKLQLKGVALKDIAILVRKNDEGQRIASYLLQYKNSPEARSDCRYDVVSNESLRIDGASSVNLLAGAMHYLLNPENAIARAQLGFEYAKLHEPDRHLADVFAVTNQAFFENNLPPAFTREKPFLKKLSLLELTETLIEIFELGKITGELTYLQAFQDAVLDFMNRERNDLGAFLEWWEDNKHKKSILISGETDAVQILTIHKSKGLQFPYVIIPFCSWGLDHDNWQAPNLWVRSDEDPFTRLGYLPVRYSKSLDETFFAAYYRDEKTRSYLDNLNLLYVAFTRARFGIVVTAPCLEIRGARESVAALLFNSLKGSLTLKNSLDEDKLTWKTGEWEVVPSVTGNQSAGIMLEKYFSTQWREKLVIKRSGVEFFEGSTSEKRARINYGIQMHAVLSRLQYLENFEETINKVVLEGLIGQEESHSIQKELEELFELPRVASWFGNEWEVKTEVPIILPGGEENRIDRLIMRENEVIIIDYKTGAPKKTDNAQVQQYIDILRQMNYSSVKGFLLYLRDKTVAEVKPEGKQRVIKKTIDKDQLGLGF